MEKLLRVVALLVALVCSPAGAAELFVSTGPAIWAKCGSNGCWRQDPLPSSFDGDTRATAIGVRWKEAELAWRDLGWASARGKYVKDEDYDPHSRRVRNPCATVYDVGTTQHTAGVSLAWAPRWSWDAVSLTPSLGVLWYRQHQQVTWYDRKGRVDHEIEFTRGNHVTPMAGLRVAYSFGDLTFGAGVEAFWRPRYRDSVAGGGEGRVGLRARFLELRYAL